MPESTKIIILQSPMTLAKRISEVRKQIRRWLESLEKPLYNGQYTLKLKKCERKNREYWYYYSIIWGKELAAFRANAKLGNPYLKGLSNTHLIPAIYSKMEGQEIDL